MIGKTARENFQRLEKRALDFPMIGKSSWGYVGLEDGRPRAALNPGLKGRRYTSPRREP
jgi:hypothetical protein